DISKTYVTIFFVGILTISFLNNSILAHPAIQEEETCIGPCESSYGIRECDNEYRSQRYAYGQCDYEVKSEDNPQCCC
ncbi:hypothetical protein CARUB_v10021429mg, partial [Capsella rubella]